MELDSAHFCFSGEFIIIHAFHLLSVSSVFAFAQFETDILSLKYKALTALKPLFSGGNSLKQL